MRKTLKKLDDKTGYYGIAYKSLVSNDIFVVHRGADTIDTTKSFATIQNIVKYLRIKSLLNTFRSLNFLSNNTRF